MERNKKVILSSVLTHTVCAGLRSPSLSAFVPQHVVMYSFTFTVNLRDALC